MTSLKPRDQSLEEIVVPNSTYKKTNPWTKPLIKVGAGVVMAVPLYFMIEFGVEQVLEGYNKDGFDSIIDNSLAYYFSAVALKEYGEEFGGMLLDGALELYELTKN